MIDPHRHQPPNPPHLCVEGWNLWLLPFGKIYIRAPNTLEGGPCSLAAFEEYVMDWHHLASGKIEDQTHVAQLIEDFYAGGGF
jgi:hypothetical protein